VEGLSLTTFWLALGFTAASVLFYWGYSFGARVVLRRLATNGDGGVTVATFEWLPESLGRLASLTTWAATAFVAVSLFARWRAAGHAPWSNMWEFTLAFAGGVMLFYIVFERWYGQRTIGSFIQPVVLALAGACPAEPGPAGPPRGDDDPGLWRSERLLRRRGGVLDPGRR